VGFLPDGRFLSGSRDMTLKLWRPGETKCLATLPQPGWVERLATSPRRGWALCATKDKVVRLWDLDRGESAARWDFDSFPTACAFGPGNLLALGDNLGAPLFLDWVQQPG